MKLMKQMKWLLVMAIVFFGVFGVSYDVMAEVGQHLRYGIYGYIEQNDGTVWIYDIDIEDKDDTIIISIPSEINGLSVSGIESIYTGGIKRVFQIPDCITYFGNEFIKSVKVIYANPDSYARQYADSQSSIEFRCINHSEILIDVPGTPATCTTSGVTEGKRCSECGYIVSGGKYISALGHKAVCIHVESTCTQEGYEYWCCERCHEDMPEYGGYASFPKIAHKFDEGIITINPAVTHTGLKTYTCTVCGATKTEIIPSKPFPKEGSIITISNNLYKVSKKAYVDGTVEYKGTSNSKNTIIIPNTIVFDGITYNVTSISKNAFKNNKKLKKVTIGNNIKTINSNAFIGCKNLKIITIKSTKISSVGKNAFKLSLIHI